MINEQLEPGPFRGWHFINDANRTYFGGMFVAEGGTLTVETDSVLPGYIGLHAADTVDHAYSAAPNDSPAVLCRVEVSNYRSRRASDGVVVAGQRRSCRQRLPRSVWVPKFFEGTMIGLREELTARPGYLTDQAALEAALDRLSIPTRFSGYPVMGDFNLNGNWLTTREPLNRETAVKRFDQVISVALYYFSVEQYREVIHVNEMIRSIGATVFHEGRRSIRVDESPFAEWA